MAALFNVGASFTQIALGAGVMIALIIGLAILGGLQSLRAHIEHHGAIPVMWRWFSGGHHHKRDPYSSLSPDRTRPHCKRRLPARLRRIIYRSALVFALPWGLFTWFVDTPFLWFITSVTLLLLTAEMVRHHWLRVAAAKHHRDYVKPIGEAVRQIMNPEMMPSNTDEWVTVDREYRKMTTEDGPHPHPHWAIVDLPRYWNGSDRHKERIIGIIRETCGMDATASVTWSLDSTNSHVKVSDQQPPPGHVTLKDIEPNIQKNALADGATIKTIALGLGRANADVTVSLAQDSPNIGLSMGPGAGKSQLARLIAAQVLHRGGIVIILDVKRISHTWARDLPNVRYAKTVEEIHQTLLDLSVEVNRRTLIADHHADWEGNLSEQVRWPRLLVIVEESNEMMARLRRYWMGIRSTPRGDPVQSPAISAYEECLFMGRQLLINMLAVAQMMTAKASGSGAARENMGVRILGRFSRNNWRMLVPEFEQPVRSMHPGRVQVVTTDVRECQVAFLTGAEAREYATNGIVTPFPKIDPAYGAVTPEEEGAPEVVEAEIVPDDDLGQQNEHILAIEGPEKLDDPVHRWIDPDHSPADDPDWLPLRGMLEYLPGKTVAMLSNDSKRDANFPKPHPRRVNKANMYPVDDVLRYYAEKAKKKQAAKRT